MSEQQRILPGGCYQPDAKKLGIKPPETPLPARRPGGWVFGIIILLVLTLVLLEVLAQHW